MRALYQSLIVSSVVFVAACIPQKDNKQLVEKALLSYVDTQKSCLDFAVSPALEISELDTDFVVTVRALDPMVKAGLVAKAERKERYTEQKIASIASAGQAEYAVHNYTITPTGAKFYTRQSDTKGLFCYAQNRVVSIENISEPVEMAGKKVVHVNYTTQTEQIGDWATAGNIAAVYPATIIPAPNLRPDAAVFVQTKQGFVHRDQ